MVTPTQQFTPSEIHLRPINRANLTQALALRVADDQVSLVAPVAESICEAYVEPATYRPFAIYPAAACGFDRNPLAPVVGFLLLEFSAGVGFILCLLIDRHHQGKGYGRAAMKETIRRLRLDPDVEMIATSYRRENLAAAKLYADWGFIIWNVSYAADNPGEVYVRLP